MNSLEIVDEAAYDAALMCIEALLGAELASPEGEQLDSLLSLVEAYESELNV